VEDLVKKAVASCWGIKPLEAMATPIDGKCNLKVWYPELQQDREVSGERECGEQHLPAKVRFD
jgi:hypothetical protein